ncbi:hypothetical protein [Corallococcus terminator]|uniref:Uncharacterized protein n=1 Tax=Corallococcus terminator TaxID=2316733 RepID=A0A3A8JCT6_9BACT|nr:hypothetical protein [Corallococcus terminator]RKG93667.1 hypothetical protein D7V88_01620 [Corallococcus terminator]
MSKLHQTLLTASVALLGLNGCGGADLPEEEPVITQQGMELAIPLPIPACAGALDSDGDGVCNLVETLLGTNPNNPDTDGDRLNDYAESFGFGGGLDLTALGANARRKDIFIEADYYPGQQPTQAMLNRVITAFSKAPVSNPDGSTGITLHIVVDQQIAAADADLDLNPVWTDFDVIKGKYFAANRAPYFHYMLFAHRYAGGNSSGISRGIPAHDFVVTLGFAAGITELQLAGTVMHELGHNIGLRHGGTDDANFKPNYLSIMNYEYQFYGFGIGGLNNVLDYSRVQVASFNELSVNEVSGFAPVAPTTEADLAKISGLRFNDAQVTGNASTNIDFNNNGGIEAATYSRDFNRNGVANVFPASQNDWLALAYDGGGQIGFATSGLTQDLGRQDLFLVAPEKMEPCLTVPERDAR